MSDVLQDLKKAAQRVVTKAREEVSCAALEQRIQDAYGDLGRAYHDAVERGEDLGPDAFRVHMDKIRQLRLELERMRKK